MNQGVKLGVAGALGILAGAGAAVLATGSAPASGGNVAMTDRAAIEKIVREYILSHPEILPEAMHNLERKEAANRLKPQADKVMLAFAGATEGAANSDLTIVEFFDYNCGYCRSSRPDLERLLSEDKKLRVVYRELPILGQSSVDAARVSLAVAKLGNYGAFHHALFAAGRPTVTSIEAATRAAGVDPKSAKQMANGTEVQSEISANLGFQQELGLSGTPSWIIGDQIINGAVGYDELKAAIAEARGGSK